MRKRVVVEAPEAFERWVAAQRAPAVEPTGLAAKGKAVFARSACVGCHRIAGVSGGTLGPDLTHFGSRLTVAAGMYPATPENVAAWVENPAALKPGAKMPALPLTKDETRALAAYLVSLK
jgi:cytochrome c oxidase subunit 2